MASFVGAAALVACTAAPVRGSYRSPQERGQHEPAPTEVAPAQPIPEEPTQPVAQEPSSCPVGVTGVSVSVEDTADGAALMFVTVGDPAVLRTQLHAMAENHNDLHEQMGALPGVETHVGTTEEIDRIDTPTARQAEHVDKQTMEDGVGNRQDKTLASGVTPPARSVLQAEDLPRTHSRATVEEIAGGARIHYTAAPEDLQALRMELRQYADELRTACAWK